MPFQDQELPIAEGESHSLTRPQRRLLRRIFNGRTVPIVTDGRSFLTYKDASRYLQTLTPEARGAAYAEMKFNGLAAYPAERTAGDSS